MEKKRIRRLFIADYLITPEQIMPNAAVLCENSRIIAVGGNITCIHCTYDPATRGGDAPDGRKVKGTIHWVAAHSAVDAEVRLFDRLFAVEAPDDVEEGHTFLENLNPNSLKVVTAKCEPALADTDNSQFADGIARYQFERMGYFCTDRDSTPDHLVFNRTCTLKDSWAKIK